MELVLRIAREGAAVARPGFGVEAGRGWGAVRVYTGFAPNGTRCKCIQSFAFIINIASKLPKLLKKFNKKTVFFYLTA